MPTGVAAAAIGVNRKTLVRWWKSGDVTPEYVTPGGHARWNIKNLKAAMQDLPHE